VVIQSLNSVVKFCQAASSRDEGASQIFRATKALCGYANMRMRDEVELGIGEVQRKVHFHKNGVGVETVS
jgi:hypothetical protein